MTTGFFTADREPALPLEIRGPDGAQSFDAVIDTRYRALTLPPDWIDALGLPRSGEQNVSPADGRVIVVPMYVGYVTLDDQAYEVNVAMAQTDPLVGTALLWGFSLHVEFETSGRVEVEPLPNTTT